MNLMDRSFDPMVFTKNRRRQGNRILLSKDLE